MVKIAVIYLFIFPKSCSPTHKHYTPEKVTKNTLASNYYLFLYFFEVV